MSGAPEREVWLDAYRRARRPPPGLQERVAQALRRDAKPESMIRSRSFLWVSAVAAVLLACLLGLVWQRLPRASVSRQRSTVQEALDLRQEKPTRVEPTLEPTVPLEAGAMHDVERRSSVPLDREPIQPRAPQERDPVAKVGGSVLPTDPVGEDRDHRNLALGIGLLRQAEASLETDPEAAMRLLMMYESTYGNTGAEEEYRALRVLATCALGNLSAGQRERRAFLDRFATSVYAARVQKACTSAGDVRRAWPDAPARKE